MKNVLTQPRIVPTLPTEAQHVFRQTRVCFLFLGSLRRVEHFYNNFRPYTEFACVLLISFTTSSRVQITFRLPSGVLFARERLHRSRERLSARVYGNSMKNFKYLHVRNARRRLIRAVSNGWQVCMRNYHTYRGGVTIHRSCWRLK